MSDVTPPLSLILELTHRCPLACPYCSNPLQLVLKKHEKPTESWRQVIQQAAQLGILQVHFTGGEPLLREDLLVLIQEANQVGLYSNLITSGVINRPTLPEQLAEAGINHVQLSVQDTDANEADTICRFNDSLQRKRLFAQAIRTQRIPLTINAVIHRHNAHRVAEFIQLAVDWDAERIEIAHVQYYGWGLYNRAALMPSRAQLEQTIQAVETARRNLNHSLRIDFVIPDYYGRYPKACMGGWGQKAMTITPSGMVLPCHAAQTMTHLTFESVEQRSLADIWYHSDVFNFYRGTDYLPQACQDCPRREIDWGGCRCQALALSQTADAIDPCCIKSADHDRIQSMAAAESAAAPPQWIYRNTKSVAAACEKSINAAI